MTVRGGLLLGAAVALLAGTFAGAQESPSWERPGDLWTCVNERDHQVAVQARSSRRSTRGDLFVALHGSWNRATRTGYKIVRVKMKDGRATGAYQDFLWRVAYGGKP